MSQNLANVTRAISHWNAGDLDRYLELYDANIRLHGYSPEPMTKPEVAAMYRGMFDSIEGLNIDVHDAVESGDQVCLRATLTGRHTGPLFGVAATGRPINQQVITILRFESAKCIERWSVADTLAVLLQIGAVTLPG
jgi:predicted ester cyclase